MNKRLLVAAALALATGSIASGCGGGDDDSTTTAANSTTTAAALSREEFLKQGNKICTAGNEQINKKANKLFGDQQPSQEELDKFATDTVIPTVTFEIAGIQALSPPSGDEDQVNAIISAAQQGLDKAKADPSLLTQGEGQDGPFADANKLAKQYGLTACA